MKLSEIEGQMKTLSTDVDELTTQADKLANEWRALCEKRMEKKKKITQLKLFEELLKFRVKLNTLGGIYSKVLSKLSDDDVDTLQSRYYHARSRSRFLPKNTVELRDIVDEWLRNSGEAQSTFRNLKLELLLSK